MEQFIDPARSIVKIFPTPSPPPPRPQKMNAYTVKNLESWRVKQVSRRASHINQFRQRANEFTSREILLIFSPPFLLLMVCAYLFSLSVSLSISLFFFSHVERGHNTWTGSYFSLTGNVHRRTRLSTSFRDTNNEPRTEKLVRIEGGLRWRTRKKEIENRDEEKE